MNVVSLFAGIGGFDLAATRAGMSVLAHVEKDANCRKLLNAKFPGAVCFDDVCTAGSHNLPKCDVLCGGWPCQDLSVAGLRAGLAGSRSGLFYELTRNIRELRPRFFVGENVPGLLSSDGGRDFARVLGELGKLGARDIAWATLDAQWFGVAQRRRRVFIVADFGGERAGEILSLDEGLRGDSPPSRKAREGITGTLAARASAGGGLGTDFDLSGGIVDATPGIPDTFPTLDCGAHPGGLNGQGAEDRCIISPAVTSKWAKGSGGPSGDECQNLVTAIPSKDHGADAQSDIAPTLRSMNFKDSHINGGGQVAIAIQEIGKRQSGTPQNGVGYSEPGDPMFTLQASCQHGVAITHTLRGEGFDASEDGTGRGTPLVAQTVTAEMYRSGGAVAGNNDAGVRNCFPMQHGVRRLTPRECERLQGFPDDWTAGFSDSVRYRMLGNAVAVPVVEWIFRRIAAVLGI